MLNLLRCTNSASVGFGKPSSTPEGPEDYQQTERPINGMTLN